MVWGTHTTQQQHTTETQSKAYLTLNKTFAPIWIESWRTHDNKILVKQDTNTK